MDTAITLVAQYALYAVALGALIGWLRSPREERLGLAVSAVVAVVLVVVAVKVAGIAWTDPRPFVVDGIPPLVEHNGDNGFPSDHTTLASAVAGVVLARRRLLGATLLAVAVALGAARVAAHLHHVPDVVAGVLLGLGCAGVAVLVGQRAVARSGV